MCHGIFQTITAWIPVAVVGSKATTVGKEGGRWWIKQQGWSFNCLGITTQLFFALTVMLLGPHWSCHIFIYISKKEEDAREFEVVVTLFITHSRSFCSSYLQSSAALSEWVESGKWQASPPSSKNRRYIISRNERGEVEDMWRKETYMEVFFVPFPLYISIIYVHRESAFNCPPSHLTMPCPHNHPLNQMVIEAMPS